MKKVERKRNKGTNVVSIEGEVYASIKHFCNVHGVTRNTLHRFLNKIEEKYTLDVYYLGKQFFKVKEIDLIIEEIKIDEEKIIKNI